MNTKNSVDAQKIRLPWGAWYADTQLELTLPAGWQTRVFELKRKSPLTGEQLQEKLAGCFRLAKQKQPASVIIVVDDLTRPVFLGEMLRVLLQGLHAAGVSKKAVRFLIGLGTHRPLSAEDMAKKLGPDIVREYECLNHDPEETEPIGEIWGKTEVKLNRHYVRADFKIVISGLTPHSFAGFSGGAKMLIPGLADMEIVAKTHKSVMMGFMGKLGEVENNRFRQTIEKLIARVGLDYFVGVVLNGDRTIADLYGGDYVQAHRQAAQVARDLYEIALPASAAFDAVILNAFPKDTELLQAENGFIPLKSFGMNLVKEGGTVVLTSACSEGMGHHGLFEPGGKLYRPPRPLRFLKDRQLVFYSPNVNAEDFHRIFWQDYLFFNDKEQLADFFTKVLPPNAKVAVFPFASLQLIKKRRNSESDFTEPKHEQC